MERYYGITECEYADCQTKYEDLARYSWDKQGRLDNNKGWKPNRKQLHFLPPRVLGYALEQKR